MKLSEDFSRDSSETKKYGGLLCGPATCTKLDHEGDNGVPRAAARSKLRKAESPRSPGPRQADVGIPDVELREECTGGCIHIALGSV